MKIEKKVEVFKRKQTLSPEAEKKESFQTLSNVNALRDKAKSVRSEEHADVSQSLLDYREGVNVNG